MSAPDFIGWDRLRHGGLLLDAQRLRQVAVHEPAPLASFHERELRRQAAAVLDGSGDVAAFVAFVLERVCGFSESTGTWRRGTSIPAEWGRVALTGETVKPRQLWHGHQGGLLAVFLDSEKRIGVGRGRKITSQVLQWLRTGTERLGLVTNGLQWRLVFAGLDFDAWCEWDLDLWFEEGELSPQVAALRTLLSPALWTPPEKNAPRPLLQAILDSRKGQAELSAVLGERVREAVELLLQGHGEVLKERLTDVDPGDIYRAAARMVMRMVVVLFAESRELLPRENALYHGSYGLTGLLEDLEKVAARGGNRLARSWSAWPRVVALFRLVHEGSHHPGLPVPAYGGELFAPGHLDAPDGLSRVLAVFESACYERELLPDRDVHWMLERITRTRVKVRQGRTSTWVAAPVDFSDLSSEYIGILYEGLLDFELRTAPAGDPVIFLAVGNQPALPLSRLEAMDNRVLANLLEKMKDTSKGEEEAEEEAEAEVEETSEGEEQEEDTEELELEAESVEEVGDERHTTRTRAEIWARRAVEVGKLARKPRGAVTPEKRLAYEEAVARKARQLITRVVLPGEWYLVRWGGTRKGAGTFYTRPGLAVPTVQRTLRPLAYDAPLGADGQPDRDASAAAWIPKKPEEILALKICDPACGSGSFLVAALRFLTDALYASLHHHGRVVADGDRAVVRLLGVERTPGIAEEERLHHELLPCRPEDPLFERRLKAVLRRHVVERCIYGVDLDPLAVELCRLALWVETMDRTLPFSFLDHKVKCGNSLAGAWFDQFQHYPAMAWKNREGGDKGHANGVHFEKEARTRAIKAFVKDRLTPDLADAIQGQTDLAEATQGRPDLADAIRVQVDLFSSPQATPHKVHDKTLALLERLHNLQVQDTAERARIYRDELLGSAAYRSLTEAMNLWCACWFWPADELQHAPLPTSFQEPSATTRAIAARVAMEKRFFHWELEFPDVFRTPGSGFDAIFGNPPWDIAKPNSKEFFSNIDPLYRTYGKQEALRFQTGYFADQVVERSWLDYNADFRAQSNFIKYRASPFGDPERNDKSQDRFAIARGAENDRLHARWQAARRGSCGFADASHPFRHQGSADLNLYKLFLEQGHVLLREGGRLGFIVPSGIYSDYGTRSLRRLFLERSHWELLFGFSNRDAIFDIHRSYKFNVVIIAKEGRTSVIQTAFMRTDLSDWERSRLDCFPYSHKQIERYSPKSHIIIEISDSRTASTMDRVFKAANYLGSDFEFRREVDLSRSAAQLLRVDRTPWFGEFSGEMTVISPNGELYEPLWQGAMIRQFDFAAAKYEGGAGNRVIWRQQSPVERIIRPQFLIEKGTIAAPTDRFRLVMRRISNATNSRTVICTLIPPAPCSDMLPVVIFPSRGPRADLWRCAVFNSFVFDWIVRIRFSGSTGAGAIDPYFLADLPFCRPPISDVATEIVAKLTMCHELFAPGWIQTAGIHPRLRHWKARWFVSMAARLSARCIIDAVVAACFGLNIDDLSWILRQCDFPVSVLRDKSAVRSLDPKGFWRVDKDKDPELRHTVLTLVAFHELEKEIRACDGNREKGIEGFLAKNDGEGWMLPETLRLADYGLGHDDRAKEHQPVAKRLGPRFYDWQLAQSPEESWRECHLHARNLLAEGGYLNLLGEILRDTAQGRWREALTFACELSKKDNLLRVFEIALGSLPSATWGSRLDEARSIMTDRGFPLDRDDLIQLIVGAVKRAPEGERSEALKVCRDLLTDHGPRTVLRRLLASESHDPGGPWHLLALEQLGEADYRALLAELKAEDHGKVAEPAAPYDLSKAKMTQRRLF